MEGNEFDSGSPSVKEKEDVQPTSSKKKKKRKKRRKDVDSSPALTELDVSLSDSKRNVTTLSLSSASENANELSPGNGNNTDKQKLNEVHKVQKQEEGVSENKDQIPDSPCAERKETATSDAYESQPSNASAIEPKTEEAEIWDVNQKKSEIDTLQVQNNNHGEGIQEKSSVTNNNNAIKLINSQSQVASDVVSHHKQSETPGGGDGTCDCDNKEENVQQIMHKKKKKKKKKKKRDDVTTSKEELLSEKQPNNAEIEVLNITEEVKEPQHQEEKMPNSLNNTGRVSLDERSNSKDFEQEVKDENSQLDLPSDQKVEATLTSETPKKKKKKKKKANGNVYDTSERQPNEAEIEVLNTTEETKQPQHQEEKMANTLNNIGRVSLDERSNSKDFEKEVKNENSLWDLPSDQKVEATLTSETPKKKKKKEKKANGNVYDTSEKQPNEAKIEVLNSQLDLPSDQKVETTLTSETSKKRKKKETYGDVDGTSGDSHMENTSDDLSPTHSAVSDKNLENPSSKTNEQDEASNAKVDFEDCLKDFPPLEQREEKNILCIFKLMYGTCLIALRRLFMEIHPSWKNQPSDAAALDKGKMTLKGHEAKLFKSGNIEQWDFSLLTTVLLFSKRCSIELLKRENYESSIQSLKEARNKLIGHPTSDKMSDDDFSSYWPKITCCLKTLGVDEQDIEDVRSDEVLLSGKHYRDLYLTDQKAAVANRRQLNRIEKKVDLILGSQAAPTESTSHTENLSEPQWDEWLRFCNCVRDFDATQNQYILITDVLSKADMQQLSCLRCVPWKMVLDFDPKSEETGFYHSFSVKEGIGNLVSLLTPGELINLSTINLARHIDAKKMLWLFVNGRENDRPESIPMTFPNWEASSVKQISRFFSCCTDPDKFDKQKPVICLVLPFRKESHPYLEVTVSRLYENFNEFQITLVALKHSHSQLLSRKFQSHVFDLSPKLLGQGLLQLFRIPSSREYNMPTAQAKVFTKLSEKEVLYLKEYLDILYIGCHNLPDKCSSQEEEENLQEFLEEHRRSFMSGQWISFESLFDNHDARRQTGNEVRTHIQRLLDQGLRHSVIVEIRHAPGSGGSTIARRVLWDLHKSYPCAFVNFGVYFDFDEDAVLTDRLATRITALEDICGTPPVILIDGKHCRIESLSNKLVRSLNSMGRRALLVRCQHGSADQKVLQAEAYHVHAVFSVNAKLEESRADLNEFEKKYKDYLQQTLNGYHRSSGLCRVFHFPLMAMMKEFRPKLLEIVNSSFDEMQPIQQEIAVLVAFIQKYANQATPALLLFEAFKQCMRPLDKDSVTYEDIKQLFTEHLLNLMVQETPVRKELGSLKSKEVLRESFTFQHRIVADFVLNRVLHEQGRSLFAITSKFLQLPVYKHEQFLPLFQDLFVYNKYVETRKLKFSVLFEELKAMDQDQAAETFCEAATKTNDPLVYCHSARFHAKKTRPSFQKAKQLIERAFEARNANLKPRMIFDSKGIVLFIELCYMLNTGKIRNLDQVEKAASSALAAFRNARNFPPTYPNPLIGEVKVWLVCIEWITKHCCGGDSDNALKFITGKAPPFFRTCISDSFYLLDIVDRIVQTVSTWQDPEETQRLANDARLSLMKTFGRERGMSKRKDGHDVIEACQAICSRKNFPRSSHTELKRLQAQYMLSCNDQIEALNMRNLEYLLKLLEELVLVEKEYRFSFHLMKVCVHVSGPRSYSLDQALKVVDNWISVSQYDCLPYFYRMVIYFMKIIEGNTLEYLASYFQALKQCRDKSQNHCKSAMSTHFIGKEGDGMSRLLTKSTLFRGETEYSPADSDKVQKFWLTDSRKKLLECRGRIRTKSFSRGREQPIIELVQGNVELYVGKSAGLGQAEKDFTPGTIVYFVVSFNLRGPVANGITFKPSLP